MSKRKLVIVYGGAFNPPSVAHITLAKQLLNSTGAKKLLFVPVGDHYKKKGLITADHRVKMLKLACNQNSKLEVNTIEVDTEMRLYTIETLDKIREQNPNEDICFIMGTDNLRDVVNWKEWNRLLLEYKIVVMDRGEDTLWKVLSDMPILKSYKANIIQIPGLLVTNVSSTLIRDRLKEGKTIGHLATTEIIKYIKDNKLYLD
jgi:nicotinate (nicotinamide) nucleotide adenylyltransferase